MLEQDKKNRRIVVTGLGVVSSIGIGWREFWKNLMAGKSGISKITAFDTSSYDHQYAGEIKNFQPEQFINRRKLSGLGRASQMAMAASKLALEDAEIKMNDETRLKIAVCMGTTTGEIGLLEKFDDDPVDLNQNKFQDNFVSAFPSHTVSANVALQFGLSGPNYIFGTACSSGNLAIARAFDLIRNSKVDYAFTGGADGLSRIIFTGFSRLSAIAPEKCQPFDRNRKGMIPGEGSGMLFLELLESALKRKAKVYAEILGYGLSCDAYHISEPSPSGIAKAIKKSIENSRINLDEVDYISAHGTGTLENDKAECQAYKKVFGQRTSLIPISSIKSMLGHTMGAAAAFETIACCLAIDEGQIPPTINYQENDPACDIDCVPNKGRNHQVKIALNNSQAFGGNNACLVLSKD